jgi:hypothetical protein
MLSRCFRLVQGCCRGGLPTVLAGRPEAISYRPALRGILRNVDADTLPMSCFGRHGAARLTRTNVLIIRPVRMKGWQSAQDTPFVRDQLHGQGGALSYLSMHWTPRHRMNDLPLLVGKFHYGVCYESLDVAGSTRCLHRNRLRRTSRMGAWPM